MSTKIMIVEHFGKIVPFIKQTKQSNQLESNVPGHSLVEAGHQSTDGPFASSQVMVAVDAHNHQMFQLKKRTGQFC